MSALTVAGEVIKWLGHGVKLVSAGASVYESVQVAKSDQYSTGEKVAVIGTNGLFAALQVADLGMDVHSTVSNYSRPEGPIEVKFDRVEVVEGGTDPGRPRIFPEGSEPANLCPRIPSVDPGSIDLSRKPGYRDGKPVSLPDKATLDSLIPLENRVKQNISAERLKNSRSKESENYKHFRMGVKGAVGVADVGRLVVKKVCKTRKNKLDIHDYFDLLGLVCSRTIEGVSFSAETYPQAFAGHQKTVKTVSEVLSFASIIFQDTRKIEMLGRLVIEKITKKNLKKSEEPSNSDSSASPSDAKAEPSDSAAFRPQNDAKTESSVEPDTSASPSDAKAEPSDSAAFRPQDDAKAESPVEPDSSALPSNVKVEASGLPISQKKDEGNKDLEMGKTTLDEIKEVVSVKDISQLQSIPKLISEAEVFQRYPCGMCGAPVRFVMMVLADTKSAPIFYERKDLEEWFREIPNKKPPKWPEALKDWSWEDVVNFNQGNYAVNNAQKEINESLKEMISEIKSYKITVYE